MHQGDNSSEILTSLLVIGGSIAVSATWLNEEGLLYSTVLKSTPKLLCNDEWLLQLVRMLIF